MDISNLIIEVTRRCNMACEHCLRGDAQDKDITRETMAKLLVDNKVGFISNVAFTGGEPSLNIQAIRDFMDICVTYNISVDSFYIATNGKDVTDEFIKVIMDLYLFCDDNEISGVSISNSQWHEGQGQDEEGIKKLEMLKIVSIRERLEYNYLIDEGRANENGYGGRILSIHGEHKDYIDDDDDVYLNVNGDILLDCDLSYESQETLKLCNVYNDKLSELVRMEEAA